MTGSAQKLLNSTTEFLQTVQQQTKESRQTFQETSKTFSGLDDSMDAAADSVGTALKSAENVYDQMDQVILGAFLMKVRMHSRLHPRWILSLVRLEMW